MRARDVLGVAFFGLAGCDRDLARDRGAFVAGDCSSVVDARLRDECLVFAAEAAPARADAICSGVEDALLGDECRFIAIDARGLVGREAAAACGRVGRFVAACHANAISREVSRLPPLEGAALTDAISRVVAQYRTPRPGEATEIARRRSASGP